MTKISGLFVVASLWLSLSMAHAAEVTQLYTNNLFASANSTDETTQVSTSVVVTREKGKGEFRDTIFVGISGPGGFSFIQGVLPKNALHITAQSASLDVDLSEITVIQSQDFSAEGVVNVDWQATDVTRTSGSTKFESGTMKANIVGTSTFADAIISASVAGSDLVNPFGFLSVAHASVIIHISNE